MSSIKPTGSSSLKPLADNIGTLKDTVGDGVKSTIDNVKSGAAAIKDTFDAGVETAKSAVGSGAAAIKDAVGTGVETLKTTVGAGAEVAKGAVGFASTPIDKAWLSQIQKLDSGGDTFTTTLGAGGSFKGIKLESAGELQIKRNPDDTYSVFAGGKVGAGLSAKLIEKPGAALKAEATLSAGAKVEYKFSSPEDAAKAARILSLKTASSAAGAIPVVGALGTNINNITSFLSGDDKFLADNVASISLGSELAGKLKAELGLPSSLGVGIDAKMAASSSMRLEFNNGKISLVASNELSGELSGKLKGMEPLTLDGSVKAKVTAEQRFELDGLKDFSKNPIDALKNAFFAQRPEGKESLSVSLEGKFGGKSSGGPLSISSSNTAIIALSLSGKPGEIYNKDVIGSILQLDFGKTANLLGDTSVGLKVSTVASTGLDINQGIGAAGTGVDLKLMTQRRDLTEVISKKAPLREIFKNI